MNITYDPKTNRLNIEEGSSITTASSIITLYAEADSANIYFALIATSKCSKTIQFENVKPNIFKARLVISQEEVGEFKDAKFKLICMSGPFEQTSNEVKVRFDTAKIKMSITKQRSSDIEDIYKKIATLKDTVSKLGGGLEVEIDRTSYVKPGMVPVAVEGGKFVPAYPFNSLVAAVNGQKPVSGEVELTPANIQYGTVTLEEYLNTSAVALNALGERVSTLSDILKKLTKDFGELEIEFENHKNKGLL